MNMAGFKLGLDPPSRPRLRAAVFTLGPRPEGQKPHDGRGMRVLASHL